MGPYFPPKRISRQSCLCLTSLRHWDPVNLKGSCKESFQDGRCTQSHAGFLQPWEGASWCLCLFPSKPCVATLLSALPGCPALMCRSLLGDAQLRPQGQCAAPPFRGPSLHSAPCPRPLALRVGFPSGQGQRVLQGGKAFDRSAADRRSNTHCQPDQSPGPRPCGGYL